MTISIKISTRTLLIIARDKKILYGRVVLERLELPEPFSPLLHSPLSPSPTLKRRKFSLAEKDTNLSDQVVLKPMDVSCEVVHGPQEGLLISPRLLTPVPSPQAELNPLDWSGFNLSDLGYRPSEKEEYEDSTRAPDGLSSSIISTLRDPAASPEDQHPVASNDSIEKKNKKPQFFAKPKTIKCTSCLHTTIHKTSLPGHYKNVHNLDWHQVKDLHEDSSFNLKKYCKWCHKYVVHITRHLSKCIWKKIYDAKKAKTTAVFQVRDNQTLIPLETILRDVKERLTTAYSQLTVCNYLSSLRGFLLYCEARDSNFKVSRMFDTSPILQFIPISLMDTFLENKSTESSLNICKALRAFLGYLNYWSLQSDGNKLSRNEDEFSHFFKLSNEKISSIIDSLRKRAIEEGKRNLKSKA